MKAECRYLFDLVLPNVRWEEMYTSTLGLKNKNPQYFHVCSFPFYKLEHGSTHKIASYIKMKHWEAGGKTWDFGP